MHINCLLTKREGRRGPYCHDRGPIYPSTVQTSSVSKLFIMWHSASDSKMHLRWLTLKGLPRDVCVMMQATQTKASLCRKRFRASSSRTSEGEKTHACLRRLDKSKLPRVRKTNLLNVKSSEISLNKTSKMLCNGI